MRLERSYATCARWSTNPSPSTCTGGDELCTDLQVLDPVNSVEEVSVDKQEVNEVTRGKRWGNNSGNYNPNHSNFNNNCKSGYKQQQQ